MIAAATQCSRLFCRHDKHQKFDRDLMRKAGCRNRHEYERALLVAEQWGRENGMAFDWSPDSTDRISKPRRFNPKSWMVWATIFGGKRFNGKPGRSFDCHYHQTLYVMPHCDTFARRIEAEQALKAVLHYEGVEWLRSQLAD